MRRADQEEPFHDWLRRRREAAGLTQLDVALKLGTDCGTISRYERGAREPRAAARARLVAAVTIDEEDRYGRLQRLTRNLADAATASLRVQTLPTLTRERLIAAVEAARTELNDP